MAVSLLCLLLGACAGYYYRHVPEVIRNPIPESPTPADVRADLERFADDQVRWGGTVIAVKNEPEETLVEVLATPLDTYGRPLATEGGYTDQDDGRFIARLPGFMDPAVMATGKKITIVGVLDKPLPGTIGDYSYQYPVVNATDYYLWSAAELYRSYGYYHGYTHYRHYPYHGYRHHHYW